MSEDKTALFLFRRDLRPEDNTALNRALASGLPVITAFIFNPRQLENNPYLSKNALEFMLQSLRDLSGELEKRGGRLYLFYDFPEAALEKLSRQVKIAALYLNRDYTPFSRARDSLLEESCRKLGTAFFSFGDALLNEPETVLKADGSPYTLFTPYYKKARLNQAVPPQIPVSGQFFVSPMEGATGEEIFSRLLTSPNHRLAQPGGRKNARALLENLKNLKDYALERDYPALNRTSRLSPHLKFGTLSIREVYRAVSQALGPAHELIRQLYWRDFFTQIAYHFPRVFKGAFHSRYDRLPWANDPALLSRWEEGRTGFPLIDAGLRQLRETGYLPNRVRMLSASLLVKDFNLDWRLGERFFASHLIDYDPALNNGNWQWAASTGADAQPYFRIFNPWSQQQKFDPQAEYIKSRLPELKELPAGQIHRLETSPAASYPPPAVNHQTASRLASERFKNNI